MVFDVDWALFGFILSVGTLVLVWINRNRIQAYLGRAVLEGVRGWAIVSEMAEDGTVRNILSPEARAMAELLTPALVATALKTVKFKLPTGSGLPLTPGQPLDLSAILTLLPKKYAPWIALALPMLERFGVKLPGSSEAKPPAGGGSGWA